MMYITSGRDVKIWRVGEKSPEITPRNVTEIQADGHELDHIRRFCTLSNESNRRVVSWFDSDAKFIAANIKWGD